MYLQCNKCKRSYDDDNQWTICPHNPLDVGPGLGDFCFSCDLRHPCPCGATREERAIQDGVDARIAHRQRHAPHPSPWPGYAGFWEQGWERQNEEERNYEHAMQSMDGRDEDEEEEEDDDGGY